MTSSPRELVGKVRAQVLSRPSVSLCSTDIAEGLCGPDPGPGPTLCGTQWGGAAERGGWKDRVPVPLSCTITRGQFPPLGLSTRIVVSDFTRRNERIGNGAL